MPVVAEEIPGTVPVTGGTGREVSPPQGSHKKTPGTVTGWSHPAFGHPDEQHQVPKPAFGDRNDFIWWPEMMESCSSTTQIHPDAGAGTEAGSGRGVDADEGAGAGTGAGRHLPTGSPEGCG